jgi:hypothetical protein
VVTELFFTTLYRTVLYRIACGQTLATRLEQFILESVMACTQTKCMVDEAHSVQVFLGNGMGERASRLRRKHVD